MPEVAVFLGYLARSASVRPSWQRYSLAVLLPIVAGAVTAVATSFERAPFFPLFTLAVLLTSLFGGMKPGFLAVGAGVLINSLLTPPVMSVRVLSVDDLIRLGVFATVGVIVSAFVGAAGELQQKIDLERKRLAVTLASIGDAGCGH